MKLRLALAAATCLALPIAAHAQPVTGPYVSLEGGTSILNSTNYNYEYWTGSGYSQNGQYLAKPSYAALASVGYGFGDGFRVELSYDFSRNTFVKDDDTGTDPEQTRIHGGQNTYGPMLDLLYDVNVGLPIFPYVGGGVGYQWAQLNPVINDTPDDANVDGGTEGSFAYNVIAGVSYPLPVLPGLSLTAEYRFKQLVESRNYVTYCCGDGFDESPVHLGQQSSHTFTLGLRYALFQPAPPPPAPAPAPAPVAEAPAPPVKTFLVFFDWDKADLTSRATEIIAEAASDSKSTGTTTLEVNGYTDTSGTPDYNMGLSERRAKAVSAQLVTDGVPASEIEIHAYGETHLLVPTGPGVREPQNRRVEIILD